MAAEPTSASARSEREPNFVAMTVGRLHADPRTNAIENAIRMAARTRPVVPEA
jgi:hypothetical protein